MWNHNIPKSTFSLGVRILRYILVLTWRSDVTLVSDVITISDVTLVSHVTTIYDVIWHYLYLVHNIFFVRLSFLTMSDLIVISQSRKIIWHPPFQGKSQHIAAKFNETTKIAEFHIQFQGGFSCKQIDVQSKELTDTISFYPDDVNEMQIFTLPEPVGFNTLRLVCLQPTDFFGRIVVYHVKFFSPV